MSLKESCGLGTSEPRLADVLAAKLDLRRKQAAHVEGQAKLARGETWQEAVSALAWQVELAHKHFATLNQQLITRRSETLKPLVANHANAARAYAGAIEGVARLERECAQSELEQVEFSQTIALLDQAAKDAEDPATAERLGTYRDSEAAKLKAIVAKQQAARDEAAALRNQLPAAQKAMASALAALAL